MKRRRTFSPLSFLLGIIFLLQVLGFHRLHDGNLAVIQRNHISPLRKANHPSSLSLPSLPFIAPRQKLQTRRNTALPLLQATIPSNNLPKASSHRSNFLSKAVQQCFAWPQQQCANLSYFFRSQTPMLRYLWPSDNPQLRLYLLGSMLFMYLGNWFSLKVPFILQKAIDTIAATSFQTMKHTATAGSLSSVNIFAGLLNPISTAFVLYGAARTAAVICAEIKACLFAKVSQNVLKKFAYQIFCHLHALDSAFHLTTPSGVISVAYVRAVRGFQTMLLEIVFSIAPAILDLAMVSAVLHRRFGARFSTITLLTFSFYLLFTIWMTQFRVKLRQELVEVDNKRNGFLIDSILNHEVVKLFTNEKREIRRFDEYLSRISKLSIDCTNLIAGLNIGQAVLFSSGLGLSLLFALKEVVAGKMSVGDLVAVNAMLLQLAVPFNNMGYTYQELRQSLVDMNYIRKVMEGQQPAIKDSSSAVSMDLIAPRRGPSTISFNNVSFAYSEESSVRPGKEAEAPHVLRGISFDIKAGENVALVGPSGSGKSTTLKLITRMLEPNSGEVFIDNINVKEVTIESLRKRIAVVPQDTCLFDETIEYNLKYGKVDASEEEVQLAIDRANLQATIEKFPLGLKTNVGERGARLSGGERQKVSIARAILRNPSLILCDEVTSSVDAFAEKDIIATLRSATAERTTVTVAHRLSSIAHSDSIIVLEKGLIVEQGKHEELLRIENGVYRRMWEAQNELVIHQREAEEAEAEENSVSNSEKESEREWARRFENDRRLSRQSKQSQAQFDSEFEIDFFQNHNVNSDGDNLGENESQGENQSDSDSHGHSHSNIQSGSGNGKAFVCKDGVCQPIKPIPRDSMERKSLELQQDSDNDYYEYGELEEAIHMQSQLEYFS